jgi:hypothetical protein
VNEDREAKSVHQVAPRLMAKREFADHQGGPEVQTQLK